MGIANLLIDNGADPDATAGFYGDGEGSTALVALVSSGHPYEAGLQEDLVDVFCRAPGARPDGLNDNGYPMATAFAFFYPIYAAVPIHKDAFELRMWLESWRYCRMNVRLI